MAGFLITPGTPFLGVDKADGTAPAVQSPAPPPIMPLQTKSKASGTAQVDQSKLTPVTPVAAPNGPSTTPTGPSTGQFTDPNASTGATNYATKQTVAPTTTSDKVTNAKTQAPVAAPVDNSPKVSADRGVESTDRDPTTGIVYDKTANNRAAETKANTYVGDDGVVHYAEQNPDGSPKSPAEDAAGWAKLSPEQQKAAMTDFKSKLEAYVADSNKKNGKNSDGTTNYLDPSQFSQLDPNGKLAAVNHFLDPTQADPSGAKADPAAAASKATAQSLTTTADGVVHFTAGTDDSGKLLPLDASQLASLTPEQLNSVKQQYATALRGQAKDTASNAANGYLGTGMDQATFESLPADQQADALEGIKPPVQNPDGTTTRTLTDGSKETKDATGRVTAKTTADGTVTAFGGDGVSNTVTKPDGTITTTDSNGKTTVTYAPGSDADVKAKTLAGVGFNPDGTQMGSLEAFAKATGATDPSALTPKQQDQYRQGMNQAAVDQWSQGEAVARAAVQAGLLSQAAYNQMVNADYAHSFGAWGLRNKDIAAAVKNSNLPITPSKQPSRVQGATPTGMPDDSFFQQLRGKQAYVDPQSLVQTDYTNDDGTLKAPDVSALAGAYQQATAGGYSYDNQGRPFMTDPNTGKKVYATTGTPVSSGTISANGYVPTAPAKSASPAPAPVSIPAGYVMGTDGKLYSTGGY